MKKNIGKRFVCFVEIIVNAVKEKLESQKTE